MEATKGAHGGGECNTSTDELAEIQDLLAEINGGNNDHDVTGTSDLSQLVTTSSTTSQPAAGKKRNLAWMHYKKKKSIRHCVASAMRKLQQVVIQLT